MHALITGSAPFGSRENEALISTPCTEARYARRRVVTLLLALVVNAEALPERRPVLVTFDAPTACPSRERYEGELQFRTDRVSVVSDAALATATVSVRITRANKRFEGTVVVTTNTGRAVTKHVGGPRCESVTAALSLAAALVLDPEGTRLGAVPVQLPPPAAPEPLPLPPPPTPVVVVTPPPPEPAPIATVPEVVAPVEPPSTPKPVLSVLALAELSTTITGSIDPAAGLMAELSTPPFVGALVWVNRLAVTAGSGRTVTSTPGSVAYSFHLNGHLETGLGWRFGMLRPELLAALHTTSVTLRGQGADEVYASTRWLADVGPRARVSVFLGAWELSVSGGAAASLTREQYRIDPDGVVFTVPLWAFSTGVSVGRSIP